MHGPHDFTDEAFYASIRKPVETGLSLDPVIYRSEAFHALEMERIWGRAWVCVGYTSQVAKTGDTIKGSVAGQPMFITRDQQGQLRAFYNVCRHRGSLVVLEDGPRKQIRCPYHSWAYSLDGRLTNTPLFKFETPGTAPLCKEDHGLLPIRVETWGCFIFVNLDPDAMPLAEYLGDLPARYGNFPLDELVLVRRKHYEIGADWKIVSENFLEFLHLPWVHPELNTVTAVDIHYRNQGNGSYMSFCAGPLKQGGTSIDADYLPAMPGLNEEEKKTGYFPQVFPNLALFLMPNNVFALQMHPVGPGRTAETGDLLVHPSLLAEEGVEAKIDEVFAFYDLVNVQDVHAVQRVQAGMAVRVFKGGLYTWRYEEPLHRFQNMVADYMTGNPRVPGGDATGS
ncbi:MAG: aromatic ring-hydroxylating dioxygenase subunit alpha [Myxococcales bacterium]|nr:aromatic ring-hydroxylating dioxygenase subunit alpha [Myxococcales bacterium]